jgi:HEAT repeat protein
MRLAFPSLPVHQTRALCSLILLVQGTACATAAPHPAETGPRPAAAPQAALRPRVLAMLEAADVRADAWKGLGPGVLDVLSQLSSDAAQPLALRAQAALSLAWAVEPEASACAQALATDAHAPAGVRQQAAMAWALRDGTGAIVGLLPLLADPEAPLRAGAAGALGVAGGPDARDALTKRLEVETEPSVREALQKALARAVN